LPSEAPTANPDASPPRVIAATVATVVLAAGMGTRMCSKLPKVLHLLGGRPMVAYALRAAAAVNPLAMNTVIVIGHGAEQVRETLGPDYAYAVQLPQRGTGHAVLLALPYIPDDAGTVLVLYGDTPLITAETVRALVTTHITSGARVTLLAAHVAEPAAYGRIVRDAAGRVTGIVEAKVATDTERAITEVNSGPCCFDAAWLRATLPTVPPSATGEIYLTDLVALALEAEGDAPGVSSLPDTRRWPVAAVVIGEGEAAGVNDRVQLAHAEAALRQRTLTQLMRAGVTITDPATTYIDDTVTVAADTVIAPGCVLTGRTAIGADCTIGPYALIHESMIGDRCRVVASSLNGATMHDDTACGPYSRLRAGAVIESGAHIGNFAEVKNSTIGAHTAMGHFSYIGDATVGAHVNIGAGTITANYDGTPEKKRTEIGDDAFIGSGTVLRAPVRVGKGAATGGQAFVNRDVPAGAVVAGVPARPLPPKPTPS